MILLVLAGACTPATQALAQRGPAGSVAVFVVDAWTGQPLPNATVSHLFHGENTRTRANGLAVLPTPDKGDGLMVTHIGYAPIALPHTEQPVVTVRLWPRQLSGRVIDATTQQPLAGAWVHLDEQWTRTDPEGRFTLEVRGPAAHLMVRAAGYARGRWLLGPPELASAPPWDAIHPLPTEAEKAWLQPGSCPNPGCVEIALAPYPVHAFYIPLGLLSRPALVEKLLDMAQQSPAINGVVVDVKGDKGRLAWDSQEPTAIAAKAYHNGKDWLSLESFLRMCRQRKLYVIARMVLFKDAQLTAAKPEWAIQRPDGSIWTDSKGTPWANPFLREVWDYHTALAREIAQMGVDEIQVDYVRFPSDGDLGEIRYGQESTIETRTEAIRQFMEQFAANVRPLGAFLSADVFGLTVWVAPENDMGIGQRVADIAPLVDYLSPMVYPSTFIPGNLGLDDPKKHPYEVVQRSTEQAITRVPSGVRVRPWLQAYGYSLAEMQIQRHAAKDGGGIGWMFWSASGRYPPDLFGPLPDLETLQAQLAQPSAAEPPPPPPLGD